MQRLFVCFSQTLNVITGGRSNEMLSSKLYRLRETNIILGNEDLFKYRSACFFCNILNYVFFEKDHCQSAFNMHVKRIEDSAEEIKNFKQLFGKGDIIK